MSEVEIDNNRHFEQSSDISEPGEIIREEVVEVTEKPNTETFPLSSKEEEDQKNQIKTDSRNRYNEDIYEQVKAQSIQLSSLSDMVESLQSQVKQLQETIRLRNHKTKTSSVRKRSTSNRDTKTKKKTKRRGNARRDRS